MCSIFFNQMNYIKTLLTAPTGSTILQATGTIGLRLYVSGIVFGCMADKTYWAFTDKHFFNTLPDDTIAKMTTGEKEMTHMTGWTGPYDAFYFVTLFVWPYTVLKNLFNVTKNKLFLIKIIYLEHNRI